VVAVGVACAAFQWKPRGPRRVAEVPGATLVGSEECLVCHEDVQGHEKIAAYHAGCESCHGAGSLHAKSEAREEIRHPANGDCLACHAVGYDTHLSWGTGDHSRAGLFCSDCHNPHATTDRHLRAQAEVRWRTMDDPSRLCVECHDDVGARLRFPSRHPVAEGMMSCLSCHDPHEDRRIAGGGPNRTCAKCHQDIVGPWIYEHAPVVDGCTLCHDPHGAATDNLLATALPALCLSCHSVNDLWHHSLAGTGIFDPSDPDQIIRQDRPPPDTSQAITSAEAMTFLRRCTDCHGAVHGSYTDEHLRH
jgi:DmsE family decaheme c-type cytochrome